MTNEKDAAGKAPATAPVDGAQPQSGGATTDNVHTPMDPTVAKTPIRAQAAAGK